MLGRLIDQLLPIHVHEPDEARHVASMAARNPSLANYKPDSPWGTTLSYFQRSDLNIINLETSVTESSRKWPDKVFNYRMHPHNLQTLRLANIDYASLANNHTLDFSQEGLQDTIESLRAANIRFAGVGADAEEANKPAVLHLPRAVHNTREESYSPFKVVIWSAADHPSDWKPVSGFSLIDYTEQTRQRLKASIQSYNAEEASLRVFSIHWGPNYMWQPADEIRALAHFLIDECEINIVHGHSSHHIQGVEIYKGKLIIYGCGDFVDDYALNPQYRNDLSAIWSVKVVGNAEKLKLDTLEVRPTAIRSFQAHKLQQHEHDYDWVRLKLTSLCADFGTRVEHTSGADGQLIIDLKC